MLLIKWKSLYASGGSIPSIKKDKSDRNLNKIVRLTVTKTEIFENVVTAEDFLYL